MSFGMTLGDGSLAVILRENEIRSAGWRMPRLCERGAEVLGIRSGELFDGHIFTSNGVVVNVRLWMTGALRVLLGNVRKDGDCGGRLISATWDWPTLIAALEVGEGPGGVFRGDVSAHAGFKRSG